MGGTGVDLLEFVYYSTTVEAKGINTKVLNGVKVEASTIATANVRMEPGRWHRRRTNRCGYFGTTVFDFSSSLSAKSQLPDRPAFQGLDCFQPSSRAYAAGDVSRLGA